jgi:hypothetical protein
MSDAQANLHGAARTEEFEAFYQSELVPEIAALETQRKAALLRIACWCAVIVPIGLGLAWLLSYAGASRKTVDGPIVATVFAVYAAIIWISFQYKQDFKTRVIGALIKLFDSGLVYAARDCVALDVFEKSRLFSDGPPVNEYRGEDLVHGTLAATAICFSDITARHERRYTHIKKFGVDMEVGDKYPYSSCVFKGVFFSADFNKNFSGATFVLPDRAQKLMGSAVGHSIQSLEQHFGQLIKLEDPEFERAFVVYSDSQIEARYILTPALMRRILDYHRRVRRPLHISFVGSAINMAVDLHKNLFEPRLFRTLLKPALYETYWHDIKLLAGLVEELNLNTRIWSKS